MTLVKFFQVGPVFAGKDSENALGFLEIKMNVFMGNTDIEVLEINGPSAVYYPPREALPDLERIC